MADTQIFMKIEGVAGESTASGYKDAIEIEGIDWDMDVQPGRFNKDGTVVEDQLRFGKLRVRKFYDLATGTLLTLANKQVRGHVSPKHAFDKAQIHYVDMVVTPDGSQENIPVVEFTLQGCFIVSIDVNAGGGGKSLQLNETIEISFKKLDIVYHPAGSSEFERGRAMVFKGETQGEED
jgi:type VI protein secretion system component Hcp